MHKNPRKRRAELYIEWQQYAEALQNSSETTSTGTMDRRIHCSRAKEAVDKYAVCVFSLGHANVADGNLSRLQHA